MSGFVKVGMAISLGPLKTAVLSWLEIFKSQSQRVLKKAKSFELDQHRNSLIVCKDSSSWAPS